MEKKTEKKKHFFGFVLVIFINIAKGRGELFATYMGLRIYLFTTFLSEVS